MMMEQAGFLDRGLMRGCVCWAMVRVHRTAFDKEPVDWSREAQYGRVRHGTARFCIDVR